MLEGCKTKLKKAGVFHKVISRVKKVCDTGNFGVLNKRYKYFKRKNIGWLKWDDGTRVYYSVFDSDKIIILMTSGSKNKQADDIKKAERIREQILKEVDKYEKK